MRRSFPFLVLLLATAAACSKSNPGSAPAPTSYDASGNAAESAAPARGSSRDGGPNVGVTAAPGVAFDYRYEFRLPPTRIAEVQEQHAQMCERLTIARCRITGMYYRVNNAHDVEANLAFRLDPAIARQFGRDGVRIVVGADGMLSESEINGTDLGPQIHQANRSLAELQADLQRIEGQLRAPNLDPDEKARLDEQAQQLREQIRAAGAQRDEAQASLATTPMVFRYTSGEPTLGQSLQDSGDSFLDSAVILLRMLIALLPWAIAAGLIWAIVRYVRRRWFERKAPAEVEVEAG
jgi:hypothetical protein